MTINAARKILGAGAALALIAGATTFTATAQDSDAAETYAKLLQQIADVQASTDQKQLFLKKQEEQIASLRAQIESVDDLKASVKPLVVEMAASAEKEMNKDVPFNVVERFARLDKLKEDLGQDTASVTSLFRQAMNIYGSEVLSGSAVASYNGNHPVNPGTRLAACDQNLESTDCDMTKDMRDNLPNGATSIENESLREQVNDGYYVHFGRMALVYLHFDSSEAWKWDTEAKEWVELSGGDILDARRAVRIARGESAPGVVLAPIKLMSESN